MVLGFDLYGSGSARLICESWGLKSLGLPTPKGVTSTSHSLPPGTRKGPQPTERHHKDLLLGSGPRHRVRGPPLSSLPLICFLDFILYH